MQVGARKRRRIGGFGEAFACRAARQARFWRVDEIFNGLLVLRARRRQTGGVHICVATDLSGSGEATVVRALAWAAKMQASVRLVHIVHDPELAPAFSDDVSGDVQRATAQLQQVADGAAVPCQVDVRQAEHIADEIVAAADGCGYLFVGSQGKSAFERLRLGSIATRVLRHSTVPVVCCPHPQDV